MCERAQSHTHAVYTQTQNPCYPSDDRVACDLPSMLCGAADVMSFIGPPLILCLFIACVCGFLCVL